MTNPPESGTLSYTLTWNPVDFSYQGHGDTSATCSTLSPDGGANGDFVTCTYTDVESQSPKSDGFNFTALTVNPSALVTVTAVVTEDSGVVVQASGTFPIAIVAAG